MKTLCVSETGISKLKEGSIFLAKGIKYVAFGDTVIEVPDSAIKGLHWTGNYIIDPNNETIYIKRRG